MSKLAIAEEGHVEFARGEFSEFLAQFLLAGLGEEDAGRRWLFTITCARADAVLERRVKVHSLTNPQTVAPTSRRVKCCWPS